MKITDSEKEFLQRLLEGEKITCSTKWSETHIFGENKKELDPKTFYSLKTKGLIYAKNTTLKNYNVEITINGIRVINGKPTTEEIKTQDILEKPQPEANFEILPVKKENNEKEEPETLGIVSLSHCQSNIFLHGSEQKHHNCVKLTINTAYSNKTKYGNRYYFPKDTIFEGYMSATQLGEFITTPNQGSGTPITISVINGKQLPPLTKPEDSLNDKEENFKEKINKLFEDATTLATTATNLLKQPGTLKAKEKEQLIKMCEAIKQEITSNLAFAHETHKEEINHVLSKTKAELSYFIKHIQENNAHLKIEK